MRIGVFQIIKKFLGLGHQANYDKQKKFSIIAAGIAFVMAIGFSTGLTPTSLIDILLVGGVSLGSSVALYKTKLLASSKIKLEKTGYWHQKGLELTNAASLISKPILQVLLKRHQATLTASLPSLYGYIKLSFFGSRIGGPIFNKTSDAIHGDEYNFNGLGYSFGEIKAIYRKVCEELELESPPNLTFDLHSEVEVNACADYLKQNITIKDGLINDSALITKDDVKQMLYHEIGHLSRPAIDFFWDFFRMNLDSAFMKEVYVNNIIFSALNALVDYVIYRDDNALMYQGYQLMTSLLSYHAFLYFSSEASKHEERLADSFLAHNYPEKINIDFQKINNKSEGGTHTGNTYFQLFKATHPTPIERTKIIEQEMKNKAFSVNKRLHKATCL